MLIICSNHFLHNLYTNWVISDADGLSTNINQQLRIWKSDSREESRRHAVWQDPRDVIRGSVCVCLYETTQVRSGEVRAPPPCAEV